MHRLFLILGGNIGEVKNSIDNALKLIDTKIGTIAAQSHYYQTQAWGNTDQPDFINLVCEVNTIHTPQDCLQYVLEIETQLGRVRYTKWGARLIDIDILYYDDLIIQTQRLTIPHPHLHERKFVLVPLCELAPDFIHPILKTDNKTLLLHLDDNLQVEITNL